MNEAETRAEDMDPAFKALGRGILQGSRDRREYLIAPHHGMSFAIRSGHIGRLITSFLLLVLTSGCFHFHLKPSDARQQPLSDALHKELEYTPAPIKSSEERLESETNYPVVLVKLTLPVADTATNKLVELVCYNPPAKSPLPVILIFPISGGDYPLERFFARYFYENGIAAIIVRREEGLKPKTAELVNVAIRQSLLDYRRVLDWVYTRKEYDPGKLGALGTSLGSLKASLLMSVDPRIKAAVCGLTGGNLPYILAYSKEGAWHEKGLSRIRREILKERGLTREQWYKELQGTIKWDPNIVGASIDRNNVLLIIGLLDTIMPTRTGRELVKTMNYPERIYVLGGHYSSVVYLYYIRSQALKFLRKHLNIPN